MSIKKRCPSCKDRKWLDEFHKNPGKAYGRSTICKECKALKYQRLKKQKSK